MTPRLQAVHFSDFASSCVRADDAEIVSVGFVLKFFHEQHRNLVHDCDGNRQAAFVSEA